jgi:hypothetical protein
MQLLTPQLSLNSPDESKEFKDERPPGKSCLSLDPGDLFHVLSTAAGGRLVSATPRVANRLQMSQIDPVTSQ